MGFAALNPSYATTTLLLRYYRCIGEFIASDRRSPYTRPVEDAERLGEQRGLQEPQHEIALPHLTLPRRLTASPGDRIAMPKCP